MPSAIADFVVGNVVVAAVYHAGAFKQHDVVFVWGTPAGATAGLLGAPLAGPYSSAFHDLCDTRRPLNYAAIRVALATGLGIVAALWLPVWLRLAWERAWPGWTLASALGAWTSPLHPRRYLGSKFITTG